eukprot:XP_783758.4 PREDICTED: uncharacterized protein LOC578501 [Strongylocentrotus purpuratus]
MHALEEYRAILEHEDYQDLCANSDDDLFKNLGGKSIPGLVGVGKRARLWPFFLESIVEEVEPLASREASPLISARPRLQPAHHQYHSPPQHPTTDVDDLDNISVATKPRRSHIITNARYFAILGSNGRYSIVVKEPPGVTHILPVTNNSFIYCDNNNTETPAIASGKPLCLTAPSTIGGPNVTAVNNNNPAQSLSCTGQSTRTTAPHTNCVNRRSIPNVITFGNINGHVSHDSNEERRVTTPDSDPYGYIGNLSSDQKEEDVLSKADSDIVCETSLEINSASSASEMSSLFGPKPQKRVVIVRSVGAQRKHDEADARRRDGKDTKKRKKAVKIAVMEDDPNAPVPKSILKNMKADKSRQGTKSQESLERIDKLFYGPFEKNGNFMRDHGNVGMQPIYANVGRGGTLRRGYSNNATEVEGRYPSPIQYSEIQHRNGMEDDESHYKHPRKYVGQADVHHQRGQLNGGGLHPPHSPGMRRGPSPAVSQQSLASTVSIQAPSVQGLTPEEQQLIFNLRHERSAPPGGQGAGQGGAPLVFPPGMNDATSRHSISSTSTLHSQNEAHPRVPHRQIPHQRQNPREDPRGIPPSTLPRGGTLPREGTIPREMRQNVLAAPQQPQRDNKQRQQDKHFQGHPQHPQQAPSRGVPQSRQQQQHSRHPPHIQHPKQHSRSMGGDNVPPPLPDRDPRGVRRRVQSHPEKKHVQPQFESHYAVGDVRVHHPGRSQPQAAPHQPQQQRQQQTQHRQRQQQHQQQHQQHPQHNHQQQKHQPNRHQQQQQYPHQQQEVKQHSLPRKTQQDRMIQQQHQMQQQVAPLSGSHNQGVHESKTNSLPNMASGRQTPPTYQSQQREKEVIPTQKDLFQKLLQPPIPAKRTSLGIDNKSDQDVSGSSKSSDSGYNPPPTKMKETCFYWEPGEELERERDMKFVRQESAKVATEVKQKKIKGRRAQRLANEGNIQLQGAENIQPQPKPKPRKGLKETTLGAEPQSQPARPEPQPARREPEPIRHEEQHPRVERTTPGVDTFQITSAPHVRRRIQTQLTEAYEDPQQQQQTQQNQQRQQHQPSHVLQEQQPNLQHQAPRDESHRPPPQHAYFSLTGRVSANSLAEPSVILQSDDDDNFFRDSDDDNSMLSIIALDKEPRVRSGRRKRDENTNIVIHVDDQQARAPVTSRGYITGKETVFSAEPDTEPNETESESSDPEMDDDSTRRGANRTPSSEDEDDEPLPLAQPSFQIIRYPPAMSPAVSYTRSDLNLSGREAGRQPNVSADAFTKHSLPGRVFYHSNTCRTVAQSKSESDLSFKSAQPTSSFQPAQSLQPAQSFQPAPRTELSPPPLSSSTAQTSRTKSESNLAVQITYEDFPAEMMSTGVQTRPNHDFSSQVDLDLIMYETSLEPKPNSISIQTSNEELRDPSPSDAAVGSPPPQTMRTEIQTVETEIQTMQTEAEPVKKEIQTMEIEIQTDDLTHDMDIEPTSEPRKVDTESAECQTADLPREVQSLEFGGVTTKFVDMGMARPRVHFDAEPAEPDNPIYDYSSPTYEMNEEKEYHQPPHEIHNYSPPDHEMQSQTQTHNASESASYSDEDEPVEAPMDNNEFPLPPEVMLMQAMPEPVDVVYYREDDELPVYPTLETIPEESEAGYSREHSTVTGTLSYTSDGDDYQRSLTDQHEDSDDDDDDESSESDDEDVETERTLENEDEDNETIHVMPAYSSIQPYRGDAVRVYVPSNSSSFEDVSSDITLEPEDGSKAGVSPAVQVVEMPYIGTPVYEAQLKDLSFNSQHEKPTPSVGDRQLYNNSITPTSSYESTSTGADWPGGDGFTAGVQAKKETLIDDRFDPEREEVAPAHRTFTLEDYHHGQPNEWNNGFDRRGPSDSKMVEIVELEQEPRMWGQYPSDHERSEFTSDDVRSSDETVISNKQSKETDIPYHFEKEYLLELPSTRNYVPKADIPSEMPGENSVPRVQPEIVDTKQFPADDPSEEETRQKEDPFYELTKDGYIEREENDVESEEDNTATVDENAPVVTRTAGGAFVIGLWGHQTKPAPPVYQHDEHEHEPLPEPEYNAEPESGFESEQVSEPVSSVDNEPVKVVDCQPVSESRGENEDVNPQYQSSSHNGYGYDHQPQPFNQGQSQNIQQQEIPYYQDQSKDFEKQASEAAPYQGQSQIIQQKVTTYYQDKPQHFQYQATPYQGQLQNIPQQETRYYQDEPQKFEDEATPYYQDPNQYFEQQETPYYQDQSKGFEQRATPYDQDHTQIVEHHQGQPKNFEQQTTPFPRDPTHNLEQQATPYNQNQSKDFGQRAMPYHQNQSQNFVPDKEGSSYTFDNEPLFDWTKQEYASTPSKSPEVTQQGEVVAERLEPVKKNISLFQSLEDRPIIDTSMPIQTPEPNLEANLDSEPNIHIEDDVRENQFSSSENEDSSSSEEESDEDEDDDDDDNDDDDEEEDEDETKVVSPLKREQSFVKKAKIVQSDDELLDDVGENDRHEAASPPSSSSGRDPSPDPIDFMNSYQQFVTQRSKSGEVSPAKPKLQKPSGRAGPPPVPPKPSSWKYSSSISSLDANTQPMHSSPSDAKIPSSTTSASTTHAPSPSDAVPKLIVSEPCPPDNDAVKQGQNQHARDKPLSGKEASEKTPVDLGARDRRWSAGDTDDVFMETSLADWRSERVLVVTETERTEEIISERTIRPKQRDDQFAKQPDKKDLPPKVFIEEKNKQESVCTAEQPISVKRAPRLAPIPNLRLSVSAKDNLDVIADIIAGRSSDNSNKQPTSQVESGDEYAAGNTKDHKVIQPWEEATNRSPDPRHSTSAHDSDTDSITTELTVPFEVARRKGKRSLTPGPNLEYDADATQSDWRESSGGVIAKQLARMRETLKRMELPTWYRKSSHFKQIMSGDIRSLPAYRNHKPRQIMSGPPTPTGHRFFAQPTSSTRMSFTREARLRTGFSPAPSVSPSVPVHSSWAFSELPIDSTEPTPGFQPITSSFSAPLRHDLSFSIGDEIHKDVRTSEFALPMNPALYRRASPDEDIHSAEDLVGGNQEEYILPVHGDREEAKRERSRSVGDEEDPYEYAVQKDERIGGSAMFYISAVSTQQQEACVSPPLPSPPPPPPPPPPQEYYSSATSSSPLPPPPPPEGYYNSRDSSPLPPPPPPEVNIRDNSSHPATSSSSASSPIDYHHQREVDIDHSRRQPYEYSGYHGDDEATLPRNMNTDTYYNNNNGNNNNEWNQASQYSSRDIPLLHSPTNHDQRYFAGSSSPSTMIRSSNPQITASLVNQPHITVTDTSADQYDVTVSASWDQRAMSSSFQNLDDARYAGGVQPPSVTMEEIVDSLLGLSTSRSPSNSFTEYSSYMDASSMSMTTTSDQSVSESDSSLETVISQDDVEARERKVASQRVTSGGKRILKSIVINDGQDDEARNITRSRGGLSDISEEVIMVKCSYKRCSKIRELREARKTYKTCHNCYTYYCSRDCRKAHWGRHKKKCLYGRVNSLCKHVIYHSRYNETLQEGLSKIARNGYFAHGRGAVLLAFSSVEEAYRYITKGLDQLSTAPVFLSAREVEECGEGRFNSLQQTCYQYDPEVKFVLNVSIVASQDSPTKPLPRRPDLILRKCAKVRLYEGIGRGVSGPGVDRETLILTAPPGVTSEGGLDMKARQVCFVHIQRQLRQRGVSLRHQFPVVYEKLCRWVEQNQHITPVTIYPRDGNTGKTFMCLIVPDTDQDTIEWVQNPEILETMDSVETVDLDAEMEKVERAVSNVALLQMTV